MLAEGKSEQEILDYFATRYGDHVLQVPPKRGIFALVWVLPVIAILTGLAWLAYLMRSWSRRSLAAAAQHPATAQALDVSGKADEGSRLEDEYLKRRILHNKQESYSTLRIKAWCFYRRG
jgi:cytochrome c-type biogenesis protein CcmH